mgnify:CR=1 FL=1
MDYKGYVAVVNYDDEAKIFSGEVINTRDVITFQGESVSELEKAFQDSVDDYLEFCLSRNEQPDKPFSGKFILRIPTQLHRDLYLLSARKNVSLNKLIIDELNKVV